MTTQQERRDSRKRVSELKEQINSLLVELHNECRKCGAKYEFHPAEVEKIPLMSSPYGYETVVIKPKITVSISKTRYVEL